MSVLFDQAYHLNHLTGATLFSVPANQLFQQPIVTLWPQSFFPPRRERLGAGQRARLALQHIQVVLQVEHLLLTSVIAFVAGDAAATSSRTST